MVDIMITTEKQKQVMEQFKNTTSSLEVKKYLNWSYREAENVIYVLFLKGMLKRIRKGHYVINNGKAKDITVNFKPLEIKELGKLNQIPKNLWEYIWQNRKVRCSQLKQKTGIPRFYIRQYIYGRMLEEFPRNREY
jgi:hypothetical protein